MSDTRQHVHEFIDRLPPYQLAAVAGLLEAMLDPVVRKLALAPMDDEPETEEEADFGLTMDDFRRMAGSDSPERKQACGQAGSLPHFGSASISGGLRLYVRSLDITSEGLLSEGRESGRTG